MIKCLLEYMYLDVSALSFTLCFTITLPVRGVKGSKLSSLLPVMRLVCQTGLPAPPRVTESRAGATDKRNPRGRDGQIRRVTSPLRQQRISQRLVAYALGGQHAITPWSEVVEFRPLLG